MRELRGKVAVVTGAANGIGRGLAERFVAEGMRVVMADIDQAELDGAGRELQRSDANAEILTLQTDVARPAEVAALADSALARFGAVHVLCNNAGVGGWQRFETTNLSTWEWTIGVDLWGPIYGCHYFLPILAKQDEAHIVNTGSMACVVHPPYSHPYNVAKAGVLALSHGLYAECRKRYPNVGVTVLCPAQVATSIGDDERHAPPGHVSRSVADPDLDGWRTMLNQSVAAGKSPAEIAGMVVDAIRTGRFYLFTHEEFAPLVRSAVEPIFSSPVPLDFHAILEGIP